MKNIFKTLNDTDTFDVTPASETKEVQQPNKQKKVPHNKAQKRLKRQRIIAYILIVCVTIGVIGSGGIVAFALNAWAKSPDMYVEDFSVQNSTQIFDAEMGTMASIGYKSVDNIEYEDLPQSVVDAFLAVEDSRFFEHNGVDYPRFTKAMMTNVLDTFKYRRLMFSQGGSTITMQLVKNTYFVFEDTVTGESQQAASSGIEGVERKFQELYMATELEKQQMLKKQDQIALYLNTINFGAGDNTLGIQSSSRRYFDKDVSQLGLVEAAFLAGVINAPNAYTPYKSIQKAIERTEQVLYLMNYHGYINDAEYKLAMAVDIENLFVDRSAEKEDATQYQAYIDVVMSEVEDITGVDFLDRPMKIYTNMNPKVQSEIDRFQNREIDRLNPGADTHLQVGSIIVENGTGSIVGIVGGYDYKGQRLKNRATLVDKQPASVVKAVLSYPLAFEYLGYSSKHMMVDAPYSYAGMDPIAGAVGNYDGKFMGEINLEYAFATSRNTSALNIIDDVNGVISKQGIIDYMKAVGFTKVDDFSSGYAIGGASWITSPYELASATSTILNEGVHIKPSTIDRIEFFDGTAPYVNERNETQVLSSASAFLTTELMDFAVSGPSPGNLRYVQRKYPVYGKTGTNQWGDVEGAKIGVPKSATKDSNMITGTDRFSIATWTGFDEYKAEHKPWLDSYLLNFNVSAKLNSFLLDVLEAEYGAGKRIQRPDSVVEIEHIFGPFPYQRPLPGMNPDLIVSGLINKDYYKLVDPQPQVLSDLKEAKVEASQMGAQLEVRINLTPYPDSTKLTIAPTTLEMKVPGTDRIVTGTRKYDDSWLYGAVQYSMEIKVNGNVVEVINSDNPNLMAQINVSGGENVEVCSYYSYTLTDAITSNKICSKVDVKEAVVNVPNFSGRHYSEIAQFSETYGINLSLKAGNTTGNVNNFAKISSISGIKEGASVAQSQLKNLNVVATINNFTYDIAASDTITQAEFMSKYGGHFDIEAGNPSAPLSSFGGNGAKKVSFFDYLNKTLKID